MSAFGGIAKTKPDASSPDSWVRTLAADPQNIFNPGKIGLWGTGTR
jgi:hypothetical protein